MRTAAARKPEAKAAKTTRSAPERETAPARAPKAVTGTRVHAVAVEPAKSAVRPVVTAPQPVVPPPLPAPIASFTF